MSHKDAHAFAASCLAATLMVSIVVFQAGDGTFGAVPADEIDGDEVVIVSEYDPFGRGFGFTSRGPGHGACAPPRPLTAAGPAKPVKCALITHPAPAWYLHFGWKAVIHFIDLQGYRRTCHAG